MTSVSVKPLILLLVGFTENISQFNKKSKSKALSFGNAYRHGDNKNVAVDLLTSSKSYAHVIQYCNTGQKCITATPKVLPITGH
jgi:hypothetical protein